MSLKFFLADLIINETVLIIYNPKFSIFLYSQFFYIPI